MRTIVVGEVKVTNAVVKGIEQNRAAAFVGHGVAKILPKSERNGWQEDATAPAATIESLAPLVAVVGSTKVQRVIHIYIGEF